MYPIIISAMTFVAVLALGGAWLANRAERRRRLQERLGLRGAAEDLEKRKAVPSAVTQWLQRIGSAFSLGATSNRLKEQLSHAGYHNPSAAAIFMGLKVVLMAAAVMGIPLLLSALNMEGATKFLVVALVAGAAFFLPNWIVEARRRKRAQQVRHHLPDVVDLLEVCVSSGMSMDMAWNLVGDDIRKVCGTLADEMALTNMEIHLGSPRATAMRNLAARTGVDEIGSLVAVLVQSERFGTSISEALKVFAAGMRESRSLRAQEDAERMAVKLLIPMILFIFPAVFVVLVGPAAIVLYQSLFGK